MDDTSFLTKDEIQACIKRMRKMARGARGLNSRLNLAIFRLSCCCGLRKCEMAGLNMEDFVLDGDRPAITIRSEITKGKNGKRYGRMVPLWWDSGTLADLKLWAEDRSLGQPFLASTRAGKEGQRLRRDSIASRWDGVMKRCLGPARASQLSIHTGRHSFISHSLAVGRSLVEVQRAVGHRSIASTGVYLHFINREQVPDIFGE